MAFHSDVAEVVASVQAERGPYMGRIAKLAAALEKDFRSERFRPWRDGDEELKRPPLFQLEAYCGRFCRSRTSARALLAVSPSAERTESNWTDVRYHARSAMAFDILAAARRAGHFRGDRPEQA